MNSKELIGQPATDFSLLDQNGMRHSLTDYRGRWLVLYFYPKDDTPGCTKEACTFRDTYDAYTNKNIAVLGVSKDTVASHKKFSDKFSLSFPLLSDPNREVIRMYGAWGPKTFMGKLFEGILRYTYLIDPEGTIRKVYTTVKPDEHAQEILEDIVSIQKLPV